MWDLRMSKRKISVLKGSSGSIRSLHMTTSGGDPYYYKSKKLYRPVSSK